ncbi:interleukin-9 receptor-like isoform X7 [Vulpes vulpes]|uniref:Interleukin-9 receptor-like isoform X7 n=1 Tax=Vulpes vulpes TaxID=9627 RepID=A0ABM5A6L6_VULVU
MGPSRRIWEGWSLESEALLPEWSTWLLICTCVGTWVGPGASVHGEGGGLEAGSFTCLNNNVLRIDCHWSAPELGQGPSPWLLFTSNHVLGSKHRCVFRARECTVVLPPEEVLVPSDNFTITFHRYVSGKEQVSLVDPQYLPRRHVKLDPPSDLQSNVSSGSCVLTWGVSLALEPLAAILSYELAFKKQEESWEQARHRDHIVGVTRLTLEAVELDPGSSYEARLRVQMATLKEEMGQEQHYEGQWSEWSQSVCFPSPQSPAQARQQHPCCCARLSAADQPDLLRRVQAFTQDEEKLLPGSTLSGALLPGPLQRALRGLPEKDRAPAGRAADRGRGRSRLPAEQVAPCGGPRGQGRSRRQTLNRLSHPAARLLYAFQEPGLLRLRRGGGAASTLTGAPSGPAAEEVGARLH